MTDKIKLFCLPYAGGSARTVYANWRKTIAPSIELIPVELAGRGQRIAEPFYKSFEHAVEDAYAIVTSQAGDSDYALFGHSMGAHISYELTHKMIESGKKPPLHLFASGRRAPHTQRESDKIMHKLSESEFKEELLKLNGTPKELFEHPELLELIIPILRNDYRILEVYGSSPEREPLNIPFTIFNGDKDELNEEEVEGWKRHSTLKCTYHTFDGDHFFINQHYLKVIELINSTLTGKPALSY